MFLNRQNVVQLKGCVACEIHSHEVLLTELLFTNMFSQFEPAEIAALLSCVIFQQVYTHTHTHTHTPHTPHTHYIYVCTFNVRIKLFPVYYNPFSVYGNVCAYMCMCICLLVLLFMCTSLCIEQVQ